MFDIAWSHLLIIGAVALIVIGPKELPSVLRTLGMWMGRARSIAREFQGSLDQMIREAELEDVRKEVEKTTSLDLDRAIENTIDPGAEMRSAFSEPPISDHSVTPAASPPSAPVAEAALPPETPPTPALAEAETPPEPAPAGSDGPPPSGPSTKP